MAIELAATIERDSPATDPDWAALTDSDLHYDCFIGDVAFRVDAADFSTPGWGWVPVLDFAIAVQGIVANLEPRAEEDFEFTESEAVINFRRVGDQVEISASYVDDTAVVPHDELLAAADAFLDELALRLLDAHPDLGRNAYFRKAVGRAES